MGVVVEGGEEKESGRASKRKVVEGRVANHVIKTFHQLPRKGFRSTP